MKYGHAVIKGGVFYDAGQEVPDIVDTPKVEVVQETTETEKAEKPKRSRGK